MIELDDETNSNTKPDSMNAIVNALITAAEKNILTASHAILEMIKNGYDADATKVEIKFNQENENIMIEDNGEGFTRGGYEAFLLFGKTNKKQNQRTKKGRLVTGMNGSGAYSTIKLGRQLRIDSYNKENEYHLHKQVNWEEYFTNLDTKLSEVHFYNVSGERREVSGTIFKIERLLAGNIDWKKLKKELRYITINKDFKVQIFDGDEQFENVDLENKINELEKYDFAKDSIFFEYNQGTITGILTKDKKKYPIEPVSSKTSGFVGIISGKYLSIDKILLNKAKKENTSLGEIFGDKDSTLNLFYNNEMLVLTSSILGIDFSEFSLIKWGGYGFRNPFGYTAIEGTQFIFNESRTDISEDPNGQYKKYKEIIEEIFLIFLGKIKVVTSTSKKSKNLDTSNPQPTSQSSNDSQSELKNSNTSNNKKTVLPNLTTTSREKEMVTDLSSLGDKLNKTNPFYHQLCYCINELTRTLNSEKYAENWNISYHALVRVYCEILFLYKLYEFYSNQNELKEILSIFKDKRTDDFPSIALLLNTLDTRKNPEIVRLKDDFKAKTNQNELSDVRKSVQNLNKHIHNPQDNLEISLSQDLIKIFTKWV